MFFRKILLIKLSFVSFILVKLNIFIKVLVLFTLTISFFINRRYRQINVICYAIFTPFELSPIISAIIMKIIIFKKDLNVILPYFYKSFEFLKTTNQDQPNYHVTH